MIKRFLAILNARNKEFLRDRAALGWNFLFPVLVVFGFAFAFGNGSQDVFKVAVHGTYQRSDDDSFFATKYVQFIPTSNIDESLQRLKRHQVDMVVELEGNAPSYWINSSSPKGYLLERLLKTPASNSSSVFQKGTVEGKEIRYVDWLISGLLAMNMMFSALFGVGYVIVRYRKNGVLKRLKATPLKPFEFLVAQIISRYILIMAVSVIVFVGTNLVIDFQMLGSYLDLFLVMSLGAVCLISLGLVMAARISSEEFAGGLLNLISWPMMFLSGVWFSLEGASPWLKKIALVFPLTHVIDASRAIMTEGKTLADLSLNISFLGILSVAFITIGSLSFRWE